MTRYVAFLRGINVGGRIVKMADLKACFAKLGFENAQTVAQTGNVIFESDKSASELKTMIEAALTETFHYPAKVQVFSSQKLQKVIDDFPFGEAGPKQHNYVIFVENDLETDLLAEDYQLSPGERIQAGEAVIYWRVDQGQTLRSLFGKTLAKSKYKNFNTNRNLNTLRKILEA